MHKKLALTPPMGWNSWDCYGAAVNEEQLFANADYIAKYKENFNVETDPINQFGAAAYDCVYAIYEALKQACDEGKTIDGSTSASELCSDIGTKSSYICSCRTFNVQDKVGSFISWGTGQRIYCYRPCLAFNGNSFSRKVI